MSKYTDRIKNYLNTSLESMLGIDEVKRVIDLETWATYTTSKLQSNEILDQKIRELIRSLPSDIVERCERIKLKPRVKNALNLNRLHKETDINDKHQWFTSRDNSFLYELLLSFYLPQVERADIIDFKVSICKHSIKNTLRPATLDSDIPPEELDVFFGEWIKHLIKNDDKITNMSKSNEKIIRRGLCFCFEAEFYNFNSELGRREVEVSGHQNFIMIEKSPDNLRKINVFVVDNMPQELYKYPLLNTWIKTCLENQLREQMPDITINHYHVVTNDLPTSRHMGSCLSTSFRAMIYSSFLYNPFRKIMNMDNTENENERIFKLMYLQMERMRYSILVNPLLWDERQDYNLYYIYRESVTNMPYNIHNINTPHLWLISTGFLKACQKEGRMTGFLKMLMRETDLGDGLKKLAVNLSLDINLSTDIDQTIRTHVSEPCKVMAEFPRNSSYINHS